MHEERIAWILGQACERLFGRERSGSITVARAARPAVTAEFLHVEEPPAFLEPRLGTRFGQGRIAVETFNLVGGTGPRLPSDRARIRPRDGEQESESNCRSTTLHVHGELPSLDISGC